MKCTLRFGICFLIVSLMYQPCCLVSCCQDKLGKLKKTAYKTYCSVHFASKYGIQKLFTIMNKLNSWILYFFSSLGSTRFLKVGRARMRDSPDMQIVVVKVFAVHDLGIDLLGYRERLLEVKRKLEGCLNCLPFQRVWVSEICFDNTITMVYTG